MSMTDLARRDAKHVLHPVTAPKEVETDGVRVVVEGDGIYVIDDRGRRIIDGFAGLWCVSVGHGRQEIIDAVKTQMEELEYFTTFHGQSHPRVIELGEKLAEMLPSEYGLNHVMFSSGGSEANETNIKLARMYWAVQGQEQRHVIVARRQGYHGLTIATMTATGIMPMRWNFGPEAPGFMHIAPPYCFRCELNLEPSTCGLACANEFERLIDEVGADKIAAFIAEPVIGAAGIIPPPPGYFQRIRELCDEHGILLIADEVVTGFGRSGTMFGFQQYGFRPDIVTFAKGITSGYLPLGASVIADHVYETIRANLPDQMPISHGFTYSGHPTCCAAALANLDIIEGEDLPGNAAKVGEYLITKLRERIGHFESVGEIRGIGLMIGIEFVADKATKRNFSRPHQACVKVEMEAWERGLYCRAMGMETVGLAPPLNIDTAIADEIIDILATSIEVMEAEFLPREKAHMERLAANRVSSVAELFARMPGRLDPAKAEGVELVVAYDLSGEGGGQFSVVVSGGTLEVRDGIDPAALCVTKASASDYVAIINGDISGADAFGDGRLAIEGDLGASGRLGALGVM